MTTSRFWALALALLGLWILAPPAAHSAPRARTKAPDTGAYVVVYRGSTAAGAETTKLERRIGFESRYRYGRAVKGFAARLTRTELAKVKGDPDVAFVNRDRPVRALGAPLATGDTAPTGIRRIGAAGAGRVRGASKVNVAVVDTGIDISHPDLNAVSGTNCVGPAAGTSPAADDNGHGTHVAGTIGARNNGAGVVGVAPATRLYGVKVLDAGGSGTLSQLICGVDWVAGTRSDADSSNDIAVANLSLGGTGPPVRSCATTTDAGHKAICNATAKGVTFVAGAGNSGWDFDHSSQPDTPAAYPEVLTVTAMGDSDGLPGAAGPAPSCRSGEADDRYASFSNFAATAAGRSHTIAAPGVCILSTRMNGGVTTFSGTSMAAPHVAGAVALCLGEGAADGPCKSLAPAAIVQKMISDAQSYNAAGGSSAFGFIGDPSRPVAGRYFGYMPFAGDSATSPPSPPATPSPPGAGPSLPSLPGVPSPPGAGPSLPSLPGLPSPGAGPSLPSVPGVPSLPGMAPSLPSVPGVPSLPGAGPSVPGLPSPSVPGTIPLLPSFPGFLPSFP